MVLFDGFLNYFCIVHNIQIKWHGVSLYKSKTSKPHLFSLHAILSSPSIFSSNLLLKCWLLKWSDWILRLIVQLVDDFSTEIAWYTHSKLYYKVPIFIVICAKVYSLEMFSSYIYYECMQKLLLKSFSVIVLLCLLEIWRFLNYNFIHCGQKLI